MSDIIDIAGIRRRRHLRRITLIGFLSREEPDRWPAELVGFAVQVAREDFYGPTWAQIAEALAMSREAALERYGTTVQLELGGRETAKKSHPSRGTAHVRLV